MKSKLLLPHPYFQNSFIAFLIFQLKQPARDTLKRVLGSRRAHNFGWRDMWAMIAIKNKPSSMHDSNLNLPIAESMSKSSDFTSWGSPVKVFQILK